MRLPAVTLSSLFWSLAAWPGYPSDAQSPKSSKLRLVDDGDAMACSGLLELKYQQRWQYLCAINWSEAMTLLACSGIECGKPVSHYFTSSGTPFTGLGLSCQGQETSLLHCAKKRKSCITRVAVVCGTGNSGVTEQQQYTTVTESPSPVAIAGLLPWLRTVLLLCGLAAMVLSVIAVEILARRRRGR
ncbi:deleted in malignant brain tumors 1 protein-like [Scleropages formosus]|uniref:deleted in malignant brain tumors 1 protein-like n=1 Tax=Scleropages formosus TaxID=113540 RepID=UPI0008783DD4|nr:deleted in malignant brain tumors 1 protein-like [Scleropages formosus]